MHSGRVAGFLPSTSGFRFANSWPSQPLYSVGFRNLIRLQIGDACNGLCGGMVYTVIDFFRNGASIPECEEPPAHGTELFAYLRKRLFESFQIPWGVFRYYRWMAQGGEKGSLGRQTAASEWPRIRREVDAQRLAPLGLIRTQSWNPAELGQNHQVLAYGYDYDEAAKKATILLYDPNHPRADDVNLSLDLANPTRGDGLVQSTGEPLRGLFVTSYHEVRRTLPTVV